MSGETRTGGRRGRGEGLSFGQWLTPEGGSAASRRAGASDEAAGGNTFVTLVRQDPTEADWSERRKVLTGDTVGLVWCMMLLAACAGISGMRTWSARLACASAGRICRLFETYPSLTALPDGSGAYVRPDAKAAAAEIRRELVIIRLRMVIFWLFALSFVALWQYRRHRDLRLLGAEQADLRIRDVLLCWVCPVLNLWIPFTVMRDINDGSDPGTLHGERPPRRGLVGLWGHAYAVSMAGQFVALGWAAFAPTLKTQLIGTVAGLIADAATGLFALVMIAFAWRVTWHQVRRRKLRHVGAAGVPGSSGQEGALLAAATGQTA